MSLEHLYSNLEENFEKFMKKFNILAEANDWNVEKRAKMLPSYLNGKALEVYIENEISEMIPSQEKLDAITELFVEYNMELRNPEVSYALFQNSKRGNETIESYFNKLKIWIMDGLPSINENDADFLCKNKIMSQMPFWMRNKIGSIRELNNTIFCSKIEMETKKNINYEKSLKNIRCVKCNEYGHKKEQCRNNITCRKCGQKGHVQVNCRVKSNIKKEINCLNNDEIFSDSYFLSSIASKKMI